MKWPFFSKTKSKVDVFLGLFLKDEEGIALVLTSENGIINIKEKEAFNYSNGWENLTDDVDEVLYRLEKKFNCQFNKTIFFVYSHLIDEKELDIKKPYLQKIKELVKNLELTAMGYIECFEAVASYLQKKEEVPLTAILVELDTHDMGIFVYKGGKMSYKKTLARTDDVANDLVSGMSDLKGRLLLPSRIILYNSHDLDSNMDRILSHRWDENYFVQLPRVDILKEDEVIAGLTEIFGEQIGSGKLEEAETVVPQETFGFLINQDIKETVEESPKPQELARPVMAFKMPTLPKFPKLKLSFNISGKISAIVGIVIIILSIFLNEFFIHKADIKIFLPSTKISKSLQVDIDYKISSVSANLKANQATTGKKQIGDPAQGTVTIRSFDDSEKSFSKGTVLTGNNLKFILDSDVKVASSTLAPDGSAKLPGTKDATVTAANIGTAGNVDKGTKFTFADLSANIYFAMNSKAFTGGNQKEVQTVAKADQENLKKTILNQVAQQKNLDKNLGEPISSLSQTELIKTDFSKEIGEESSSISLSATAQTSWYFYDKSELINKIIEDVKDEIPSGYTVDKSLVNYEVVKAAKDGNKAHLNLNINLKALKDVPQDELKKSIVGQNKNKLESILKEKYQVDAIDFKMHEPIPVLSNFFPFFQKNINLTIGTL